MRREIRFYRVREPFGGFSNFSQDMFMINGVSWPTVEHYYQAMKHDDLEFREQIRSCHSPKEAKNLAYKLPAKGGWDDERYSVMRDGLRAKFTQHDDLRELLLSTGDAVLIENSPSDYFWGCGADGSGKNMLGNMLMELRESLMDDGGFPGLAKKIVSGEISPDLAIGESLSIVENADRLATTHVEGHYLSSIISSQELERGSEILKGILEEGSFSKCRRGVFASMIFETSTNPSYPLCAPFLNHPPEDLHKICMWDGGCIRDMMVSNDVVGTGYEGCPSIHSAERMFSSNPFWVSQETSPVWIEMGMTLKGDSFVPFRIEEGKVYPCLRCLCAALERGVRRLIVPDFMDLMTFKVCDVRSHASHLMMKTLASSMGRDAREEG